MKNQKRFLVSGTKLAATALGIVMFSVAAQARDSSLINGALNQSLQERADVQRTYEVNPAAARPDETKRKNDEKIQVDLSGELGSGRGSLKGFDRTSAPSYREDAVAKYEKELREINRDLQRESNNRNLRR